ncbi:MAG: choice-of-anchor Q domain-containing protein [Gammaproteobacteria bacterium]
MTDSAVSDNGARFVGGVFNDGSLTLTNSSISGNGVSRYVGGLSNNGSAKLINSTVSKNTAYGLFAYYGSAGGVSNFGTLVLTNSTVSGNVGNQDQSYSAPGAGGIKNAKTLIVTNSTISSNQSTSGNPSTFGGSGGIQNAGKLILSRSLISGNTGAAVAEIDASGTVTANKFNLFGHSGDSGVVGFIPGVNDLVPVEALNRIVAALGNNGGPTQTHALPSGSPALDAVERGCPPPATDQRGEVRPLDGDGDGTALCDTGAFERTVAVVSRCGGGPTSGCTVNGYPDQLCLGTPGPDVILGNNGNNCDPRACRE